MVTLAFFALAAHALDNDAAYGRVSLLWAVTFLITSVIYRPIEQLLARSIAESRARGAAPALRTPLVLQACSAVLFVVAALAFKGTLVNDLFGGEEALFWVLVGAVTTYSLSYFARGWLAGSGRPELYGVLVFIESSARCVFPIVALLGLSSGTPRRCRRHCRGAADLTGRGAARTARRRCGARPGHAGAVGPCARRGRLPGDRGRGGSPRRAPRTSRCAPVPCSPARP